MEPATVGALDATVLWAVFADDAVVVGSPDPTALEAVPVEDAGVI